jgi:membrane-associated phospholipid phosphatase
MFFLKRSIIILLITLFTGNSFSQNENKETFHPYKLCLKADIPVTAIGIGGTIYGVTRREGKSNFDSVYVLSLHPSQLPRMDRDVTKQNNELASKTSDVLLVSGFVLPWFLAFDKGVRSDLGTVSLMYLETMAITGMGYWLSAGLIDKARPYVYNKDVPLERRISKHSKDSFYGGHVSVTAAGTFFIAKVFNDYHPESSFRYVLWSFAGVATAANAYARYRGGYHFTSDIAIGAVVGTIVGIAVPVIHHKKKKKTKVTLSPVIGEYKGLSINYNFE